MIRKTVIIFGLLILIILSTAACKSAPSVLASTSEEVANLIEEGMELSEVADSINAEYGKTSVYAVNCESLSFGSTVAFVPTKEYDYYYIWFFIPEITSQGLFQPTVVKGQVTAVCFAWNSETGTDEVVAIERFDYEYIAKTINEYGVQVVWGQR